MKHGKANALMISQDIYKERGIELEYTEDFYDVLADKAIEMKQGVTGIEKSLLKVFQSINAEDIRASEVEKIILNGEVVNNPNAVILIPREKQKIKRIK